MIGVNGRDQVGYWPILPAPAPRQVRRNAWAPTPSVLRYRAFRDEVRLRNVWAPKPGDLLVFLLPIPRSWSAKRRAEMEGQPHEQRPDVDNLAKALLDSIYGDDSHIWALHAFKVWSSTPGLCIVRQHPAIAIPFHPEVSAA